MRARAPFAAASSTQGRRKNRARVLEWGIGLAKNTLQSSATRTGAWVFAYGSLMWNPEFEYLEVRPALLRGYHRAFCIFSHVYRGSAEKPGLVLGLDRGGACRGRAFRISPAREAEVLVDLDAREQVTGVYLRRRLAIDFDGDLAGTSVRAEAYVADPAHLQYAGKVAPRKAAQIIAASSGSAGPNREYFESTVAHLETLGIRDRGLQRIQKFL